MKDAILLDWLRRICRVLKIDISEDKLKVFLQFLKFCAIGVSNLAIFYVIYVFVVSALRAINFSRQWDFIAGNIIAWVLSVLWSFYWNELFVFGKGRRGAGRFKALLRTYACYAFTGLFLNNVISWLWIDVWGGSTYAAPAVNLPISTPINFLLNKLWAFGKSQEEKK